VPNRDLLLAGGRRKTSAAIGQRATFMASLRAIERQLVTSR